MYEQAAGASPIRLRKTCSPSPTHFDRDVLPKWFRKEHIIRKPAAPFEVLIGVALTIAVRASRR